MPVYSPRESHKLPTIFSRENKNSVIYRLHIYTRGSQGYQYDFENSFFLKHSRACLYTYTLIQNFLKVILLRCHVSKSSASCRLAYSSTDSSHFMNENFEKRKKLQFNKQTEFLHDSREVVTSFIAQNAQSALFSRKLKSVRQVSS